MALGERGGWLEVWSEVKMARLGYSQHGGNSTLSRWEGGVDATAFN